MADQDATLYPFAQLTFARGAEPAAASADEVIAYVDDADGHLKTIDESGTVTDLAETSAGIGAGTSFPGSPTTNDRYFRTDRGIEYFYDGTRWLSVTLYREPLTVDPTARSADAGIARWTPWHTTYDLWLEAFHTSTSVATTNNGSQYWTVSLIKYQADFATSSSVVSFTTAADAPNVLVTRTTAIGALLAPSTYKLLTVLVVKTSTPGAIQPYTALTYRLVG